MYARVAEISLTFRGSPPYTPFTMAAKKKTPSTVKTLQAKPKIAAKRTTTKPKGVKEKRIVVKPPVVETVPGKKTSLDVLRLFIETYENL